MSTFDKKLASFVAEADKKAEDFLAIVDPAINDLKTFIGNFADGLTSKEQSMLKAELVKKLEEVLRRNIKAGKYTCLNGLETALNNKPAMIIIKSWLK